MNRVRGIVRVGIRFRVGVRIRVWGYLCLHVPRAAR